MNAENFVNTKAIKELLIKGASRYIADRGGMKAVDHVYNINDE
jgi:hypothetical protein